MSIVYEEVGLVGRTALVGRLPGIRTQSGQMKVDRVNILVCLFYPVPRTSTLSHRKPPSAGHPVTAALLRTAIQNSVLPCDPVNTSRYVVWWLCCFTVKLSDRKAY